MAEIKFKQASDLFLTGMSKIGQYAGLVGGLVAVGVSPTWATLSLVPDALKSLYDKTPWAKEREKRFNETYKSDISDQEGSGNLKKHTGNDFLRKTLDNLCKKAKIDPSKVNIYSAEYTRDSFYAQNNNIVCSRKEVDAYMKMSGGKKLLKFIIAHELSHIVTGDSQLKSPQRSFRFVDFIANKVSPLGKPHMIGTVGLAMAFNPAATVSVVAVGAVAAYPFYQRIVNFFGARINEYRADRNAVTLTKDLKSAEKALGVLESKDRGSNSPPPQSYKKVSDIMRTMNRVHPQGGVRISPLRRSFNEGAKKQPLTRQPLRSAFSASAKPVSAITKSAAVNPAGTFGAPKTSILTPKPPSFARPPIRFLGK